MRNRTRQLLVVLLALVFALSALGAAMPAQGGGELVVRLSASQAAFAASQPVLVQVEVSNAGGKAAKVLKWFTPAEEVEEPIFSITRDGQPVRYLGAIYKRPAPTGADYITLKPGQSFTRTVNLADYYDFSASGTYTVRFAASSPQLFSEKSSAPRLSESLSSNSLTLKADGRTSGPQLDAVSPAAVTGATSFNKCTVTQQNTAISARAQASTYSADALAYLNANKQAARYTTWFGVFDAARYATVKTHFSAISSAMDTAPVKIDCGCKKPYYAYVYPTRPYTVYVCKAFWTAPMTGTDSKAGTLIHEMSHFDVVAGTDDFVYGQAGAKDLAITAPANAINNADNHEYFAENTPALP